MILRNDTSLNTVQLKAFIRKVALNEHFTPQAIKALRVRAIHRKRSCRWANNHVTGYAYYNSPNMCLKFMKGVMPDKVQMAKTVAHELAHTQGVHHRAMNNSIYGWKAGWREHWAWAEQLPLELDVPVKAAKPERSQVAMQKAVHCSRMAALYERKARLALAKHKKWLKKQAYWQKAIAKAQSPEVKKTCDIRYGKCYKGNPNINP